MMDVLKKVPVREQEPQVRAKNFEEVCLGYNAEEAVSEANRCINCKNARCIQGCPVAINIPEFIHEVKEGNFAEAAKVIGQSSALPAVCDAASGESKGNRSRLENWSVLLLIGPENIISTPRSPDLQMAKRLQ